MGNNRKYAIFTMDVEDFSDAGCLALNGFSADDNMLDGMDEYIDLLEHYGIKATLFTLKTTAVKIEEKLKEYARRGHSIALHGLDHTPLHHLDREAFKENIRDAKEYFESLIGKEIRGYRAPFFGMDNEKLAVLRELGFKYDSSSHDFTKNYLKGKLDIGDFDRKCSGAFFKDGFFEFSLSCQNILGCSYPVSGGGYVRLCPWFIVKSGLKRYIKNNDMYVFYLHPFELSKNRSHCLKGVPAGDKHYLNGGIKQFGKKIEKIIEMLKKENYTFITFDELCDMIETKELSAETV